MTSENFLSTKITSTFLFEICYAYGASSIQGLKRSEFRKFLHWVKTRFPSFIEGSQVGTKAANECSKIKIYADCDHE